MDKNTKFAVINTGGKQYKVAEGDKLNVELVGVEPGKKVTFSDILLLQDNGKTKVGTPTVSGATVTGKVEEQIRGEKLIIFKKKRRKGYQKATGHRQELNTVTIEKITAGKKAAPKKKAEAAPAEEKAE